MAEDKVPVPGTAAAGKAAQVWTQSIRVRSTDVTKSRVMRISTLLKYIQEGTVRHTTELGMGRDRTLDRGLLWIITQQDLQIRRLPGYEENVTLSTWPGQQLHLFFPRYTVLRSEAGEDLVSSRALWVLMDEKTRKPVFPERHGIHIEGISGPGDFPLRRVAHRKDADRLLLCGERAAGFSECDINGHMNNSEYFDLLDDMLQDAGYAAPGDGSPLNISAEYIDEIRYGSTYTAELYRSGNGYLFQGRNDDQMLFRIRIS